MKFVIDNCHTFHRPFTPTSSVESHMNALLIYKSREQRVSTTASKKSAKHLSAVVARAAAERCAKVHMCSRSSIQFSTKEINRYQIHSSFKNDIRSKYCSDVGSSKMLVVA